MGAAISLVSQQDMVFLGTIACQSFYVLSAVAIFTVYLSPALSSRFLAYGARAELKGDSSSGDSKENVRRPDLSEPGLLQRALDSLASLTVSHNRFVDFYTASVFCSAFWLACYVYSAPSEAVLPAGPAARLRRGRVLLVWLLMLFQGVRRRVETTRFQPSTATKTSSSSQMHVLHYVFGMAFYVVTSAAIWLDAASDLAGMEHSFHVGEVTGAIKARPLPTLLFLSASYAQHLAHRHLFLLRQSGSYKVPTHRVFRWTLTPHYAAECCIYLALARIAPTSKGDGAFGFSRTMVCAVLAVAVNLGVTADGTRRWYERRFGRKAVESKARMIPFVW